MVEKKLYYTMGEVAEMFDVKASLIRHWESKFSCLRPHKNKKGNRLFSADDIERLKQIYHLVKERGMTLDGANKVMRASAKAADLSRDTEMLERLQRIRAALVEVREELKLGVGEQIVESDIDEPVAEEIAAKPAKKSTAKKLSKHVEPAAEPIVEVEEVAPESVTEPVSEPAAESAVESIPEPDPESVVEPTTEPAAEPTTEPQPESVVEQAVEQPKKRVVRRKKKSDDDNKELFPFYEQSLF